MGKKYDLAVVTGTYQKDGETKKRYENIGVVMENDNGMYMLLKKDVQPSRHSRWQGVNNRIYV